MKTESHVGMNRTGIATSPIDSKDVIAFAEKAVPPEGDAELVAEARGEIAAACGNIGSIPPPASFKGLAKVALDALKGNRASVFVDKLGERLAFERAGSRLYEALLGKLDAVGSFDGGPSRERLEQILTEEIRHAGLVCEAIETLGGDPTVVTPSADVVGVASIGLVQVVTDPRTTIPQCLCAMLIAELADHDGWAELAHLARAMGHDDIADAFDRALAEESEHLADVRRWVRADLGEATAKELPVEP